MNADYEPFVAAVCAAPADDLPRLIFADWLDERGDPYGEFIRIQCARARATYEERLCRCVVRTDRRDYCQWCLDGKRAEELRDAHGHKWYPDGLYGVDCHALFRRGFVETVLIEGLGWVSHHARILSDAPVLRVELNSWPMGVRYTADERVTLTGLPPFRAFATEVQDRRTVYANDHWPGIAFLEPPQMSRAAELPFFDDSVARRPRVVVRGELVVAPLAQGVRDLKVRDFVRTAPSGFVKCDAEDRGRLGYVVRVEYGAAACRVERTQRLGFADDLIYAVEPPGTNHWTPAAFPTTAAAAPTARQRQCPHANHDPVFMVCRDCGLTDRDRHAYRLGGSTVAVSAATTQARTNRPINWGDGPRLLAEELYQMTRDEPAVRDPGVWGHDTITGWG